MEDIKCLLEDYKIKLQTITIKLSKGGNDLTITNLGAKSCCYRNIIHDLELIISSKPNNHFTNIGNCKFCKYRLLNKQ